MLTRILLNQSNKIGAKSFALSTTQMRSFAQAKLLKFDYKDPLMFDDLLTDEERMI